MKLFLTVITILGLTFSGYSQDNKFDVHKNHPTKEEVMSQKVAFFTQELQLTPDEAEKFWPIYNEGWEKMHNARRNVGKSLRTLNAAIKNDTKKDDKEINTLMDKYFKACEEEVKTQRKLYEDLCKVIPVSKAAKVFISEERFRVMLIKQLKSKVDKK